MKLSNLTLGLILGSLCLTSQAATLQLRLIETTDIHSYLLDYDYYRDTSTEQFGLVRTAALIEQAREEVVNSVLVDNGDLIQGNPLGDYVADKGLSKGEVHPVYKVMNPLGYEVGNIGNHEFNFGLEFLDMAVSGAEFPYICANVFDEKTGETLFQPYIIKAYEMVDDEGQKQEIHIGYIGFVPPQIMNWDRNNLEDRVTVADIRETAASLVPQMKEEGADLVIAIPHSGLSTDKYELMAENSVYYLADVDGIDAIAFGHSHAVFPGPGFSDLPGVDNDKGTIKGVAAVMPGYWGSHLGLVDLTVNNDDGFWQVIDSQSVARPIFDVAEEKALVEPVPELVALLQDDHNNTRSFVNQPIGKSSDLMYSFLALVQDDPTVQIVNLAQADYVQALIKGDPDLAELPVLAAAAPFKAGGRKNDPTNYTEVESGQLTFRNAADLYLYPNTLVVLKASGDQVREWLECSAGQFNQIDPASSEPQALINWDDFRTYNFDVIDGVEYRIDLTQPARYDGDCNLVNPESRRIVDLHYKGKPIDPAQAFLIASNNYRAYSGQFPGTGPEHIVIQSPDENRTIVANYISRVSDQEGQITPTADNNWRFAPIEGGENLKIYFETSPSEKASQFIKDKAIYPMTATGTDDIGFALYQLDLTP